MTQHSSTHKKTGTHHSKYKDAIAQLPDGTVPIPLGSGVIQRLLGEGGTSFVYEIWNEKLGIKRAVKLLKPNASRKNIDLFNREIKILAQLNHPNVINVHSVGEWNNLPYIEMDLVDGFSLEQIINEQGALPLIVVLAMAIEMGKALDYTHNNCYKIHNVEYTGLLHRDLKPANILLPKNDSLRLTDFGIATLATTVVTTSTRTGTITGSMQYMAPEQLEEEQIDQRCDIYSFGCILYEMVTGAKVFPEKSLTKLVKRRVQNDFISIRKHKIKMPLALEQLIMDCLSSSIDNRPRTMKEVLGILESLYKKMEVLRRPEQILSQFMRGEKIKTSSLIYKEINRGFFRRHSVAIFLLTVTLLSLTTSGILLYPYLKPKVEESPYALGVSIDNLGLLHDHMILYNIDDPYELMTKLDKEESFHLLADIIEELPQPAKTKKWVRIFEHRTIVGLRKESGVYYDNSHINDGEFYLDKGRFLYNRRLYKRAVWILKVAKETPAMFIDAPLLYKEILYYVALSESALWRGKKEGSREQCIDRWRELQKVFQNDKNHPYYKKARQELTRLRGK